MGGWKWRVMGYGWGYGGWMGRGLGVGWVVGSLRWGQEERQKLWVGLAELRSWRVRGQGWGNGWRLGSGVGLEAGESVAENLEGVQEVGQEVVEGWGLSWGDR